MFQRDIQRFLSKVAISLQTDICWEWQACRHPDGHGKFSLRKRTAYAHRVAWQIFKGPIPMGLQVLHDCDNPPCCNPAHLFLGTVQDNRADAVAKGRHVCGEKVGNSKLIAEQVLAIRADSRAQRAIAKDYGVSRSLIGQIKQGLIWQAI